MPFEFECPHCGKRTHVDDRYSGQTGPCAGCGKPVTVPAIGRGGNTAYPTASGGGALLAVILLAGVVGVFFCGGIMMWGVTRARVAPLPAPTATAVATSQCGNNLRTLAVAMHNYHNQYGSFPPSYVADEDGQPMHSWRVLILPYLGYSELYEEYDFDEPWNGPKNSALLSRMPTEFRCPDDMLSGYDQTSYAMISGPGMVSDGQSTSRFADITDGTSPTLLIVEAQGCGIAWTEPRDLDGATMTFQINSGQMGEIRGHSDHVNVACCDAAVHQLPVTTPPQEIRAMASIDGGEVVAIP